MWEQLGAGRGLGLGANTTKLCNKLIIIIADDTHIQGSYCHSPTSIL